MRRARDVREQIEGLMTRVEIEMTSNPIDDVAIRKVYAHLYVCIYPYYVAIQNHNSQSSSNSLHYLKQVLKQNDYSLSEPSKTYHNLFTFYPILMTLTPLEFSQISRSDDILH